MTAPDLTPEVLEELTKALADYKAACAAGNGEKMYRTGNRVEALCWAHFPALLAAAQRVQDVEAENAEVHGALLGAWARVRAYESVIRDHDNTATPDVLRGLLDQFKALRAKVAELEVDRERMDLLESWVTSGKFRELAVTQRCLWTGTFREWLDAARQAGKEEG